MVRRKSLLFTVAGLFALAIQHQHPALGAQQRTIDIVSGFLMGVSIGLLILGWRARREARDGIGTT